MKKIIFLLFILCIQIEVLPQRNANFGVFAGTAYYFGDINPNKHFYKPAPSFGLLYRYNLNKYFSIRANGYYARLTGNDVDFPTLYHPGERHQHPAYFKTQLIDLTLQIEFNFFPYSSYGDKWDNTPYVAGGIGYSAVLFSETAPVNPVVPHMTFPFGIGYKINLSKKFACGIEWSFRKAFSDKVDGVTNDIEKQSLIHNNDWYSFAGIFITYKFFNFAVDCPVYE